ncbi:MAG: hypothetical protein RLO48_11230, partial [Bauldia litoralis]
PDRTGSDDEESRISALPARSVDDWPRWPLARDPVSAPLQNFTLARSGRNLDPPFSCLSPAPYRALIMENRQ